MDQPLFALLLFDQLTSNSKHQYCDETSKSVIILLIFLNNEVWTESDIVSINPAEEHSRMFLNSSCLYKQHKNGYKTQKVFLTH